MIVASIEVFDVKDSESLSGNMIGHLEVVNLGSALAFASKRW